MKKIGLFFGIFVFSLAFYSCTAKINGSLQGNGQADLVITASLEPRITALIGGIAAISGAVPPGSPILNGPEIASSMSASPGIASASFKNINPSSITGQINVSHINEFLAGGKTSGFITFEQPFVNEQKVSGGGRCTINLNLDSGPDILGLISPDASDYLNLLMAPLATGEVLTKTEYIMLVGSVYGRGIADEISKALVSVSIDFPGQVISAKGGTFAGKKVEYNIPLLDLLVLETPLNYEVIWK